MKRFEVVDGVHIQDQREYKKGSKVDSPLELDKMFPGKFKDLGPSPVSPKPTSIKPAKAPGAKTAEEGND